MIFDTHAHYDDEKFDEDRDGLLQELYSNGIGYIVNASADINSLDASIELSGKYDFVYAALGIHPHYADQINDEVIERIKKLCKNSKVVAIGEIGLDYYYDNSPRDIQKHWFERQIELAKELELPIIIHDRDAHEDTLNIIKKTNAQQVGGIFHCFTGSREMALDVLKHNLYIAVGGAVTFKNSRRIKEVVEAVPLDRLVIETDCPYLTPEPYRGKRNNSGYLIHIIEKIAEIKGVSSEEIEEATLINAKKVFKLV
ncbi:TatD family hydrolase [Ruminiclostridium cellulolyticum]|uniref:Hydrolase, TatD family n=1 Tax=Ruminiclostridium cellulolyticum (strain ATCC 35319 / DSM 5812 / JCM 6584 / H10) TaxID=394503 RepID=B8I4K2_RUMCH|nr:TatD family hydrolase [Ruminiclostridium cellulolyticum]ACL74556.1 hydrolase, TatD family [Ruminiclostridium cellulolyticum H10]